MATATAKKTVKAKEVKKTVKAKEVKEAKPTVNKKEVKDRKELSEKVDKMAKDYKPESGTTKDIYKTWENRLRNNIKNSIEKSEDEKIVVTASDKMFPSYCRAKGMEHKDVVKAVKIVKSYVNDVNEIAADVITETGKDDVTVKFKLNGINNAKDEDATHALTYLKDGLQVTTADGIETKDLSTSVNDMFFGSTNSSKLFKSK